MPGEDAETLTDDEANEILAAQAGLDAAVRNLHRAGATARGEATRRTGRQVGRRAAPAEDDVDPDDVVYVEDDLDDVADDDHADAATAADVHDAAADVADAVADDPEDAARRREQRLNQQARERLRRAAGGAA